jgi:ATP-dependent DNA helicase RecQ
MTSNLGQWVDASDWKHVEACGVNREQFESITQLLQKHWGFSQLRDLQLESMSACLTRRDSLTVLPTGAGKSICFQLPALIMEGTAVVVSPLISLMKDQVDGLKKRGIAAAFVNSSLTPSERQGVMEQLTSGKLKLLYIAPERLMLEATLRFLARQKLSFIAIDEAHCVSGWGHDFRPEYRELGSLKQHLPEVALHCFTATASPRVRQDIVKQLKLQNASTFVADMDRPNLFYRAIHAIDRTKQICQIIDHYPKQSGIIFCLSRKDTERLAGDLRLRDYNAVAYHAGLGASERKGVQDAFVANKVDVIVATVAFGMGIDKPDIRFVIHNSIPQSIENYLQECGRAGRDGLPSECVIFYRGGDRLARLRLTDDEAANRVDAVRADIHGMADFAASTTCRRKLLLASMGQRSVTERCGACDNCLSHSPPVGQSDSIVLLLLEAVKQTGQYYGSKYVREVVRGDANDVVRRRGHYDLACFGSLKSHSDLQLEDWLEQLQANHLLASKSQYGTLQLTGGGEAVLGKRQPACPLLDRFSTPNPLQITTWNPSEYCDPQEFKRWVVQIAADTELRAHLPPSIAWEFTNRRPHSKADFEQISQLGKAIPSTVFQRLVEIAAPTEAGLPKVSFQDPWGAFVATLPDTIESPEKMVESRVSNSALRIFPLFDTGMSIHDVAANSGLAISTVTGHLNRYLEIRNITDCSTWVPNNKIKSIEEAIRIVGNELLKPIFEYLQGAYSYDDIRLVCTTYGNRQSGSLLATAEEVLQKEQ